MQDTTSIRFLLCRTCTRGNHVW